MIYGEYGKGGKAMAREKQHVFSARTTEEGLKALNETKGRLKLSWDELVIEAVSAHFSLDKAMMTLPKKEKPTEVVQTETEQPPKEATGEGRPATAAEEKPTEEAPNKKRKKGSKAK
jgi:hypothetical protein